MASSLLFTRASAAAGEGEEAKITGVTGWRVLFRRPKMVGKNSRLDVHGDHGFEQFLQIHTDSGVTGVGWCPAEEKSAARLLGTRVADWFRPQEDAFDSPFVRGTAPLWDLLGKLRGEPVWRLLGGKGTEKVPVYDGSIYFADLLPEHGDAWREQFKREIDASRKAGHNAFKIKIGRGAKWMEREAGDERDVEVVRLIREHGGEEAVIGVDANNGYDLDGAKAFMRQVGDLRIAFAEELFEETVEDCLAMKAFIREQGWETLLADGETQGDLEVFSPLMEARALDVLQGDMRRFDYEGVMEMADIARPHRGQIAPHNWGSVAGFYMQLQVGRAVDNFYMAEQDPGSTPALVADGVTIEDGLATVPDAPGGGLELVPDRAPEDVERLFQREA